MIEVFLTLIMGLEIPESPCVLEEKSKCELGGVKKECGGFCGEEERSEGLGTAPGGEKGCGFCGEVESSRLEFKSEPLSTDIRL